MKYVLSLTAILFVSTFGLTQNLFYGYPTCKENLNSGDIIVLSGPPHADGRFLKSKNLNEFIDYFSKDFDYKFRIEVNIFYGGDSSNATYSKFLCLMLRNFFKERKIEGVTVVSNGSTNPIYLDKNSKLYKQYNTRMEIHIE